MRNSVKKSVLFIKLKMSFSSEGFKQKEVKSDGKAQPSVLPFYVSMQLWF
jgi:hypothetical protein